MAAQGIARAIFAMIRFRVGIGRRPHMLEIIPGQRHLIRRKRVRDFRSALTGREDNKGDNRERGGREK